LRRSWRTLHSPDDLHVGRSGTTIAWLWASKLGMDGAWAYWPRQRRFDDSDQRGGGPWKDIRRGVGRGFEVVEVEGGCVGSSFRGGVG
jgi:hypothetical protein